MPSPILLDSADYPARLRELAPQPACVWLSSPLPSFSVPWVAIVGTRRPSAEAEAFAESLASDIARAGGVVVSGGALGIDSAAHRGALNGGGATCVVMPTGHEHTFPRENGELFARVRDEGGTLLWPFAPEAMAARHTFRARNGVLVALADAVVIVQAGFKSGARNAAKHARDLHRPTFATAGPPWATDMAGSTLEVAEFGATLLQSKAQVLKAVGLAVEPNSTTPAVGPRSGAQELLRTDTERRILEALRGSPRHKDELCAITALPPATVSMALLTLSLEHVLVEGPDGSFRRNLT